MARRTAFELRKARERAHILCGLAVAVSNVDEVVATIRASEDATQARQRLMTRRWPASDIAGYIALIDDPTHKINDDGSYNLSQVQARAILDLRLQRLTQLGVKEVTNELEHLAGHIQEYLGILSSRDRILSIIQDELTEVRDNFAVPRRTEIIEWAGDLEDEDLIERKIWSSPSPQGGISNARPWRIIAPETRGQGAARHGDQGRRCGHHAVCGKHPHPAFVFHHRWHGL